MGTLGNLDHERFCQAAHKRIWAGEQRKSALTAAYLDTVYDGDKPELQSNADNARRLANQPLVKARLAELSEYSGKLAGIDASWALVQLKRLTEFNVDDYLTPANEAGLRFFDISKASREQLSLLVELAMEELTEGRGELATHVRKTKIKGHDPIAALSLMARIAGWEAPKKTAFTDVQGNSLEALIIASMKPKEPPAEAARLSPNT
jgi:hypothetical protein